MGQRGRRGRGREGAKKEETFFFEKKPTIIPVPALGEERRRAELDEWGHLPGKRPPRPRESHEGKAATQGEERKSSRYKFSRLWEMAQGTGLGSRMPGTENQRKAVQTEYVWKRCEADQGEKKKAAKKRGGGAIGAREEARMRKKTGPFPSIHAEKKRRGYKERKGVVEKE